MLNWLQPQLNFKELALGSVGPPPSTRGSIPLPRAQVCLSYWEGCLCLWVSPSPPLPMMSYFLWQDAHHLRETASVPGTSCFVHPARVDTEGLGHFHKNSVNRKPYTTFSCPVPPPTGHSSPVELRSPLSKAGQVWDERPLEKAPHRTAQEPIPQAGLGTFTASPPCH